MNTLMQMRQYSDNKVDAIDLNSGIFTYHSGGKRTSRKGSIEQVVKDKRLLFSFDKPSITLLVSALNMKKSGEKNFPNLSDTFSYRQQNWLLFFSSLYVTIFISTNIFGGRFIHVFGMILPGGIYGFPLTFAILDIVTEYYGLAIAKKVIWNGVKCLYLFVGLIYLYYYFGPLYVSKENHQIAMTINKAIYELFFHNNNILVMTISGSVAIAISDTCNCHLMSFFKKLQGGNHLWIRCLLATSIAETIFSFSWLCIYALKTGYLPASEIVYTSMCQTIIKSLYEVAMIPPTYMVIFWFRYKESKEYAEVEI